MPDVEAAIAALRTAGLMPVVVGGGQAVAAHADTLRDWGAVPAIDDGLDAVLDALPLDSAWITETDAMATRRPRRRGHRVCAATGSLERHSVDRDRVERQRSRKDAVITAIHHTPLASRRRHTATVDPR